MYVGMGQEFGPAIGDPFANLVCVDGVTYKNVKLAFKSTGKLGTNGPCPGFDRRKMTCSIFTGRCDLHANVKRSDDAYLGKGSRKPPPGVKLPGEKPEPGPGKRIKLNEVDLTPDDIAAMQSLAMDPNIPIGTKIGTLATLLINKGRGKLIPGGADNKAAFLNELRTIKLDHPDFAKMVVGPGKTLSPDQKMAMRNLAHWVAKPATREALYRVLVRSVTPPNWMSQEKQKAEAKILLSQLKAKGFSAQPVSSDDSSLLKPVAYIAGAGLALYLFYRYTRKN